MLNFAAGSSQLRCGSELSCSTTMQGCPGWTELRISAPESTVFRVRIGLSGGIRGYQSITGNVSIRYTMLCALNMFICAHTPFTVKPSLLRVVRLGDSLLHQ